MFFVKNLNLFEILIGIIKENKDNQQRRRYGDIDIRHIEYREIYQGEIKKINHISMQQAVGRISYSA